MIKVQDVNAFYDDFHVFKNVSLEVEEGRLWSCLAPTAMENSLF